MEAPSVLWQQNQHNKVVAARRLIYEKHYAVHSSQVKELLKNESLVPTLVQYYLS